MIFNKTAQQVLTSVNSGMVNSGLDENVEILEIEALHTTYNNKSFIIKIEPAELSISDNFSIAMGAGDTGYGRMDPVGNYTGTTRTIDISFVMIRSEVMNGEKGVSNNTVTANLLKQALYPSYIKTQTQNTSVIKTPPYFRIKYGDLIGDFESIGLTGFFSSVRVSNESGYEGIADNIGLGANGVRIPIEYSVSLNFNVIHEHLMGWYDGKFADDGRLNFPFNSGMPSNPTQGGPSFAGSNNAPPAGTTPAVPGSPSATAAAVSTKGI